MGGATKFNEVYRGTGSVLYECGWHAKVCPSNRPLKFLFMPNCFPPPLVHTNPSQAPRGAPDDRHANFSSPARFSGQLLARTHMYTVAPPNTKTYNVALCV